MQKQELLRGLPKIDDVMRQESLVMLAEEKGDLLVTGAVREVIANLRMEILDLLDETAELFDESRLTKESVADAAEELLAEKEKKRLFPIINATGTILHTNLGRAPLCKDAMDSVAEVSKGYSSLEYNVAQGKRGSRHDLVGEIIKELTGAEDAMVVNNNAAATMIVLATLGKGKEIIVSRGELVEIGGAFRIPDIMKQSGAYLTEVGTSNKTRLSDYENAIYTRCEKMIWGSDTGMNTDPNTEPNTNPNSDKILRRFAPQNDMYANDVHAHSMYTNGMHANDMYANGVHVNGRHANVRYDADDFGGAGRRETGALMKVHKSNYDIIGFTEEASLEELAELGHRKGIPVIFDMGNGLMLDMSEYGLNEPNVPASLAAGADVMLFSGDKLLGGPQAGIIVGKKEYIKAMKKHPLARALRVDKMTFAALEATLLKYRDPKIALRDIPVLRMIASGSDVLKERAERLAEAIRSVNPDAVCEIVEVEDQIGGGSAPMVRLPGFAVAVRDGNKSADRTERKLRKAEVPVVARINEDRLLLCVRTITDEEINLVAEAMR